MGIVLHVLVLLWGLQDALAFVTVSPGTATTTKAATATTSTILAASTEGEAGPNTRQGVNRKDALRRFGGVAFGLTTGAAWAGLAMGGAGATLPSAPAAAAGGTVTRKSLQELQFEMLKKGLDLTHAFQFEEAEDVYTQLIRLFDIDYANLSDRDKQLVAKYVIIMRGGKGGGQGG